MILTAVSTSLAPRGKPRASGDDPWLTSNGRYHSTVNPARAGMILSTEDTMNTNVSKPRASGDDPGDGDPVPVGAG